MVSPPRTGSSCCGSAGRWAEGPSTAAGASLGAAGAAGALSAAASAACGAASCSACLADSSPAFLLASSSAFLAAAALARSAAASWLAPTSAVGLSLVPDSAITPAVDVAGGRTPGSVVAPHAVAASSAKSMPVASRMFLRMEKQSLFVEVQHGRSRFRSCPVTAGEVQGHRQGAYHTLRRCPRFPGRVRRPVT